MISEPTDFSKGIAAVKALHGKPVTVIFFLLLGCTYLAGPFSPISTSSLSRPQPGRWI